MRFDILIVEPDVSLAEKIAGVLEKHERAPHCQFVSTGRAAMEYLKRNPAFLLITEFVLPDMDAFGLLDFINHSCPEIPVMVVANEVKPRTQEVLKKKGVSGFLLKPLDFNVFMNVFNELCQKTQSGGALSGVSLDAFVQVVEMEQKSYIIRVFHMETGRYGALFFQEGELVHARIVGAEDGTSAAEEILSWQPVSLIIENGPIILRRSIHAGLQALLMEAMRLRDEREENPSLAAFPISSGQKPSDFSLPYEEWLNDLPFDAFSVRGMEAGYNEKTIFQYGKALGEILGAGGLIACFFCSNTGEQYLVSPKNTDVYVVMPPSCDREKLLRLLEYQVTQD